MKRADRPLTIRLFALCYLAQLLVTLAINIQNAEWHRQLLLEWFNPDSSNSLVPIAIAVRLGIGLLPLWLVWARAARFAQWMIVAFFLPKLAQIGDAWFGLVEGRPGSVLWLAGFALYFAATVFLFRRDSRNWFATKGGKAENNAGLFD